MCDLFEITAFVTSITTLITLADKNVPRIKIINIGLFTGQEINLPIKMPKVLELFQMMLTLM